MKLKLRKVLIKNNFIKKKKHKSNLFIYILGEIYELKAELNSDKRDRKKEAVKKVILRWKRNLYFFLITIGYCKYDSWKRC